MLDKNEIQFFEDIAYYHVPFTHCPNGEEKRMQLKCHCNPKDNFDWNGYSCKSSIYLLVTTKHSVLTTAARHKPLVSAAGHAVST